MTDELQHRMDVQSRHGTYEVNPNHPAFGATYCPMCGGGVDRNGDCTDGHDDARREAAMVIGDLCRFIIFEKELAQTVAQKIIDPELTVRKLAVVLGIGHSAAHERLERVARKRPAWAAILGMTGGRARSQQARRKREGVGGGTVGQTNKRKAG